MCIRRSLPARGARIEIAMQGKPFAGTTSRSPQGERGLKFRFVLPFAPPFASLPARGARIEIGTCFLHVSAVCRSLPARGARIEMATHPSWHARTPRRSPQGERGLKSAYSSRHHSKPRSLPARGARIEIWRSPSSSGCPASLPARGARIEIFRGLYGFVIYRGRSPQGERGLKYAGICK